LGVIRIRKVSEGKEDGGIARRHPIKGLLYIQTILLSHPIFL